MDEQKAYASDIAAEAVGERLGSPPPDTREQTPPPAAASAGPRARVTEKDRGITWREVGRCLRGRHDERSAGAVPESFSTRCNRSQVSDSSRFENLEGAAHIEVEEIVDVFLTANTVRQQQDSR
jgi:hypothetical protein